MASFTETAGSSGFTAGVTGGTGAYQKTDEWVEVIFVSDTTTKVVYHLTDQAAASFQCFAAPPHLWRPRRLFAISVASVRSTRLESGALAVAGA